MNNNKNNNSLVRASIGLMMLSGAICVSAQTNDSNDTPKAPIRKVAKVVNYKMKTVSGTVLDAATKEPIEGARVAAYGNARFSIMTDENGNYNLEVPVFVNSLYVTVPEYNDLQVAFDGENAPTAELYSTKFNNVYSTKTSITSSNKATVNETSAITIDGEIDKAFSGDVHTVTRSGMRGQGIAMFIRGINSININAQPLVILDGMIIDCQLDRTSVHDGFFNNILAGIDPDDIESVEVLKNATSIYGARGANGVILINTKRGKSMATKIEANINTGFELMPSSISMMNASQFLNYASELVGTTEYAQKYASWENNYPFLVSDKNYYWYPLFHNETDWSDGLYRTAITQNYKVGVQGGDERAMYNLSLGSTTSQSTAKGNDISRFNIRFNTDIQLSEYVSTQLDLSFSNLTYNLRDNGWAESYASSTISSPNVLGLIQSPFLSKYGYYTGDDLKLHESSVYAGKYIDDNNYPFDYASAFGTNAALANPYWILENGDGNNKNHQQQTQFYLNLMPKYTINKHLYITNRFAYQFNRSKEKYYLPKAGTPIYTLEGYGNVTTVVKSLFSKETAIQNDFRINWSNQYGMHQIEAFGGVRYSANTFTDTYMIGYNASNDKMPDMNSSLDFRSLQGNQDKWRNLAYYVDGRWSIKDTYILEATMSAETSSRFGRNTDEGIKMFGVKWGLFPSVQAGWVISNEKFMRKAKGVDYLKFTVGYDISGNDNIDYSASRTYFKSYTFLREAIALQLTNVENTSLQWETTRSWNFALNGSFLKNRIQAGLDVYVRNTDHLITPRTTNYMSGLKSYLTNDGALRNIGAEVHLNGILVNTKNFKAQLGASVGHYKNEITSLPEKEYINKIYGAEILTRVGNSASVFYGYKTNGVLASKKEASTAYNGNDYLKYPTGITAKPYNNFNAGDMRFVDLSGDGIIDENDKTIIGNPNPDLFGSIYANLSYKHWSLDINFKYSLGNDIYNYQRSQLESCNNFYNQTSAVVNRWKNEGQVTDIPRAMSKESDNWVNNERFSDRWIEDGSFLKLKKVRLSYELPMNLSWLQGLTIWGEANNVFTVTPYTGTDPEFSCSNSVLYQGIDAGLLAEGRSFNLGVKINF